MNKVYDLPLAYPDELWYSRVARYHRNSGNMFRDTTTKELFGTATLRTLAPCGIDHTPILYYNLHSGGEDVKELYFKYTLAPFLLRYHMPQSRKKIFDRMMKGGPVHGAPSVLRRIPNRRMLWYCPLCRDEDIRMYGEMYWHREHQIEMIPLCAKHHCRTVPCMESCNRAEKEFLCADGRICPAKEPQFEENTLPDYIMSALTEPFPIEKTTCMDVVVEALLKQNLAIEYGGKLQQDRQGLYCLIEKKQGEEYALLALRKKDGSENALRCAVNRTLNVPTERILPFVAALSIPPNRMFAEAQIEPQREKIKQRLFEISKRGYVCTRKSILAELGIRADKLEGIARECGIKDPLWRKNWKAQKSDTKSFRRMQAVIYLEEEEARMMEQRIKEMEVISRAEFIRYCIRKELGYFGK